MKSANFFLFSFVPCLWYPHFSLNHGCHPPPSGRYSMLFQNSSFYFLHFQLLSLPFQCINIVKSFLWLKQTRKPSSLALLSSSTCYPILLIPLGLFLVTNCSLCLLFPFPLTTHRLPSLHSSETAPTTETVTSMLSNLTGTWPPEPLPCTRLSFWKLYTLQLPRHHSLRILSILSQLPAS